MKKRVLGLTVVMCIMASLITALPITASAAASGICGDNLTWTLDDSGTLTISGSGDMWDYSWGYHPSSWYQPKIPIKTVIIKDGVTSIGSFAFDNYDGYSYITSIESVTISDSVKSIGADAFCKCTGIKSLILGNGVTKIGEAAFTYCSNLTSVNLPNGLITIGSYAFNECTSLSNISFPDSICSMGGSAFSNTAWYNAQPTGLVYAGNVVLGYKGTVPQNLVINDGTTVIGGEAFYNCNNIVSVIIPNGVTCIGEFAFAYCYNLVSANIPDSVKTIESYAFDSCQEIVSLSIPNSITTIGYSAFEGTQFYNNLPDGVIYFGNTVYGYKGTMPENTEISIKVGTKSIGESAFFGEENLVSVTIPDTVENINETAFYACKGLTSVKIPDSVTSIGENTFADCSNLETVTISNSIKEIPGSMFARCNKLTYVTIPETVEKIGRAAFQECSNLLSVEISNTVIAIGTGAFQYCSNLSSIKIPQSVKNVSFAAFGGCQSLTDVYYGGSEEDWNSISVNEHGNDDLLNATIHYNSTMPDNNLTIVKTEILADGVFNTGGYGSINLNPVYKDNGWEYESLPCAALIDRNGNFAFPYKETFLRYYCYDDVVSLISDNAYTHYRFDGGVPDDVGYYSLDGNPLFSSNFWGATPMCDGYAFVTEIKNNEFKSRLIDKTGKTVLDLKDGFTQISGFCDADVCVQYDTLSMAIWFSDGLLPCWSYSTQEDYFSGKNQAIFYIDTAGQTAFTLQGEKYSSFWSFSEGLAGVRSKENGKIGYIDKLGNLVIPCEYSSHSGFTDGLSAVSKNGKYGYINKKNETVIPFEYDNAYGAGDGLASVVKDGKCGLVDYNNNVVVPLEYDDISSYDKGVAYAIKDGYVYIITGYEKSNIPHTTTAVSVKDGQKIFTVSPTGVETSNRVILALYKSGNFIGLKSALYNGEDIRFETDMDCDKAKVMVWGGFASLKPVTNAEMVNVNN